MDKRIHPANLRAPFGLGVCPQPFLNLGLEQGLERIKALGFDALELPVHAANAWVDLEALAQGDTGRLEGLLKASGLSLTCLSVHQEGQLLLGPYQRDTDHICPGGPENKRAYGLSRLRLAAEAAQRLGLQALVGFVGCEDGSRWFPWPDEGGFERMWPAAREVLLPLLDEFAGRGVRFLMEPHPRQIVYNLETAQLSLAELQQHEAWGFNLDPANLLLAGLDPVCFVAELGARIGHVHAKDGERVEHRLGRSGLLAHGAWDRPERGFRFRAAGWGNVPWKRLISELILMDYRGYLVVENEDPLFAPEDGLVKAREFLEPLLPKGPREQRWW